MYMTVAVKDGLSSPRVNVYSQAVMEASYERAVAGAGGKSARFLPG